MSLFKIGFRFLRHLKMLPFISVSLAGFWLWDLFVTRITQAVLEIVLCSINSYCCENEGGETVFFDKLVPTSLLSSAHVQRDLPS